MRQFFLAIGLVLGGALAAFAASNFAINNATGTFTILKTVENADGSQSIVIAPGTPAALTPLATTQRITSLAAAAALTVPTGATLAVVTADQGTANIRWRDDGTNPTASVGLELSSGATFTYAGSLSAIKFIQETTTPATPVLNIAYYK